MADPLNIPKRLIVRGPTRDVRNIPSRLLIGSGFNQVDFSRIGGRGAPGISSGQNEFEAAQEEAFQRALQQFESGKFRLQGSRAEAELTRRAIERAQQLQIAARSKAPVAAQLENATVKSLSQFGGIATQSQRELARDFKILSFQEQALKGFEEKVNAEAAKLQQEQQALQQKANLGILSQGEVDSFNRRANALNNQVSQLNKGYNSFNRSVQNVTDKANARIVQASQELQVRESTRAAGRTIQELPQESLQAQKQRLLTSPVEVAGEAFEQGRQEVRRGASTLSSLIPPSPQKEFTKSFFRPAVETAAVAGGLLGSAFSVAEIPIRGGTEEVLLKNIPRKASFDIPVPQAVFEGFESAQKTPLLGGLVLGESKSISAEQAKQVPFLGTLLGSTGQTVPAIGFGKKQVGQAASFGVFAELAGGFPSVRKAGGGFLDRIIPPREAFKVQKAPGAGSLRTEISLFEARVSRLKTGEPIVRFKAAGTLEDLGLIPRKKIGFSVKAVQTVEEVKPKKLLSEPIGRSVYSRLLKEKPRTTLQQTTSAEAADVYRGIVGERIARTTGRIKLFKPESLERISKTQFGATSALRPLEARFFEETSKTGKRFQAELKTRFVTATGSEELDALLFARGKSRTRLDLTERAGKTKGTLDFLSVSRAGKRTTTTRITKGTVIEKPPLTVDDFARRVKGEKPVGTRTPKKPTVEAKTVTRKTELSTLFNLDIPGLVEKVEKTRVTEKPVRVKTETFETSLPAATRFGLRGRPRPQLVFEELFGAFAPGEIPQTREATRGVSRLNSLLFGVSGTASSVKSLVGTRSRAATRSAERSQQRERERQREIEKVLPQLTTVPLSRVGAGVRTGFRTQTGLKLQELERAKTRTRELTRLKTGTQTQFFPGFNFTFLELFFIGLLPGKRKLKIEPKPEARVQGYYGLVKETPARKSRYRRVTKALPLDSALQEAFLVADNTIAQSVRLVKANSRVKAQGKPFGDLSYKFRRKGSTWIEKRGNAIDTLGEKQNLKVAAYLKRQRQALGSSTRSLLGLPQRRTKGKKRGIVFL